MSRRPAAPGLGQARGLGNPSAGLPSPPQPLPMSVQWRRTNHHQGLDKHCGHSSATSDIIADLTPQPVDCLDTRSSEMNLPLGSPHAPAQWQILPAHRYPRPPLRNPKRALEGPRAPGTMCPRHLSPQPAGRAAHSYELWHPVAWQWVKSAPWCLWPQPQAQIPGRRLPGGRRAAASSPTPAIGSPLAGPEEA